MMASHTPSPTTAGPEPDGTADPADGGEASSPTDAALARRAALGDRRAFALVFERHAEAMFRYAVYMLGGDVGDAEDAVQTAWIKAWQHLPDFRGDSSLRTWLFTITANEVRALRRRARPVPVDDQLLVDQPERISSDPARVLVTAELWDVLAVALSELPWRQRATWVLRELEGFSYDDIAEVLGTSPTVVRGQLHRARRTVAVRMEQWR